MGAGRRPEKAAKNAKRKPRAARKRKPGRPKKPPRPKDKPGRPKKHIIDLERAVQLAALGMPQAAVATALGISLRTLTREKASNQEFADAYDRAVREGNTDWETTVSVSMLKAIRAGHTGPLLAAWETLQNKYAEKPDERPLILEIPLSPDRVLLVPEGLDPIAAVEHAENVLEVPCRDDVEEVPST